MIFFAEIGTVGLLVLGALGVFAGSLLLRDKLKSGIRDREATTTSSRGEYVPLIYGRRRTGAAFCWVGDREVKKSGGGGLKGFFGGSGAAARVYFESAMHAVSVGPGRELARIWVGGKEIFTGPITPATTPSGTVTQLPDNEGEFTIYWGELNQPVDTDIADPSRVGIASRWPCILWVKWFPKKLGGFPRWDFIDYEIAVSPSGNYLNRSTPWMPAFAGSDDGANPAHVLADLLWNEHPWGMGRDQALYDIESFEQFGELAAVEQLAVSVILANGETADTAIGQLMDDCGVFLADDDGIIRVKPIREPTDQQAMLSDRIIGGEEVAISSRIAEVVAQDLVFEFSDRDRNFKPNTYTIDEDGEAVLVDGKRGEKVAIDSAVNYSTAIKIANRRSQASFGVLATYEIDAGRESGVLCPGISVRIPDVPHSLRLMTVENDCDTGRAKLELVQDFYGVPEVTFEPAPTLPGDPVSLAPAPALHTSIFRIPPTVPPPTSEQLTFGLVRPHEQIVGFDVHVSSDGTTYHYVGTVDGFQPGGTLTSDIFAADPDPSPAGLYGFTPLGPDMDRAQMLPATEWQMGQQRLAIGSDSSGGEVMYVRSIDLGAGTLGELIRAQDGTPPGFHGVGETFMIARYQDLEAFSDPLFVSGATLQFKFQPFTTTGERLDLATLPVVSYTVP